MPKSTISSKKRVTDSAVGPKPSRAAAVPTTDGSLDGATDLGNEPEPNLVVLPDHEEIASRAYALSTQRRENGLPGDEMSDWLQAEREILAERS